MAFHDITTQIPHSVSLAIHGGSRLPPRTCLLIDPNIGVDHNERPSITIKGQQGHPSGGTGMLNRLNLLFDKAFLFFLAPGKDQKRSYTMEPRRASIKDMIESLGVPHTEVGAILVNNKAVDFSFVPEGNEKIVVKAIAPPFDITRATLLRPHPFKRIRFVVDVNAGKLARLLLILGIDTLYSNRFEDKEVADISVLEQRIVLTRDTGLLKQKNIVFARRVRENDPSLQLREVFDFFGLGRDDVHFLSRCTACNCLLQPVEKQKILPRLKPKTKRFYTEFSICPACSRIFWKGSHHRPMELKMEELGIPVD